MKRLATDHQNSTAPLGFRRSRIEFTKATERRFFFSMTVIMLVAGILYKIGVW
jgi:hypothetical protein